MQAIWIGIVIVLAGTVLLRFAGRRSISQMTFGSVMVMLTIGTVIATPIGQENPWWTLVVVAAMLATLMILEYLQVKFNWFERLMTGKAKIVIKDGILQENALRRLRMSADKLEMRLRQVGVQRISDVKTATLEVNGELGYELKPEASPLTLGQFERIMSELIPQLVSQGKRTAQAGPNLFDEITDSEKNAPHRKHLQ